MVRIIFLSFTIRPINVQYWSGNDNHLLFPVYENRVILTICIFIKIVICHYQQFAIQKLRKRENWMITIRDILEEYQRLCDIGSYTHVSHLLKEQRKNLTSYSPRKSDNSVQLQVILIIMVVFNLIILVD